MPIPWSLLEGILLIAGKGYVAGVNVKGAGKSWRLPVANISLDTKKGTVNRSDVDMTAQAMSCSLVFQGKVYFRNDLYMRFGDGDEAPQVPEIVGWTEVDLASGKVLRRIGYPTKRPWGGIDAAQNATAVFTAKLSQAVGRNWSHRCYPDIALPSAILSQTTEIVPFDGSEPLHMRGVRGQCTVGYGLGAMAMFTPPNQCLGCYPMIRGMVAYEQKADSGATTIADADRLVKGEGSQPKVQHESVPSEWTMYRGNVQRTGCTSEKIDPQNLVPSWSVTTSGGRGTQAVILDGILVIAGINTGRITALNAQTGATVWETSLPGRIDTAPSLAKGKVFVGCHDGYVYALNLYTGNQVWRFNAAPKQRRIVVADRVESAWPVLGSVLVHDGLVHAMAGHHTSVEGGLHLWGLDPETGEKRYHENFTGIKGEKAQVLPAHWYKHEEAALNNILFGGKVGETSIVRLYDEWGGWDFRSKDGTFLRQHEAIPQPGWPKGRVTPGPVTLDDRWPWVGHDRMTSALLMQGLPMTYANGFDIDPRTRFSGSPSSIYFCPRSGTTAVILRVNGGKTTVDPEPWMVPTDPKIFGDGKPFAMDPTRKAADIWTPITVPVEAAAGMITNERVIWFAGTVLPQPASATQASVVSSALVAVNIDACQQVGRWDFPGTVAYEGLSAANGRIFVVQSDGTVRSFAVKGRN